MNNPSITYDRLAEPFQLVAKADPAKVVNFIGGWLDSTLSAGTPFTAVGKAQVNDASKTVYFMRAEDFGEADTLGAPVNPIGINTIEVSPAPANDGEKIDVHVTPPDPNKWMQSYQDYPDGIQTLIAARDVTVFDLANIDPPREVIKGTEIDAKGEFSKDGIDYIRTKKSVDEGKWYGIPKNLVEDESYIDNLTEQTMKLSSREKVIAGAASAQGFLSRLFKRNKR